MVFIEEMTSPEVAAAIKSGKTTILIVSASTEASGPHLVLGKHIFRARYLAERIATELGNALIAPIMPYAPATDETRFPGTINVSSGTFSRVNEEIADSMVKAGFKYVVLIGDHDGNQAPLKALADKLDPKYRARGARVFYSSDAYYKSNREIETYLSEHGFPPSRHAGVADTSSTLTVSAKYVRVDQMVVGGPVPGRGSPLSLGDTGVEGDPRRASAELGKMFMELKVKNAVQEIHRLIQGATR